MSEFTLAKEKLGARQQSIAQNHTQIAYLKEQYKAVKELAQRVDKILNQQHSSANA